MNRSIIERERKETISKLESTMLREQELAKMLFGHLDDQSYGETFNTFCRYSEKMRSCVYFLRNEYNGMIKIGKTDNLPRRLQQIDNNFLQCGLLPKSKIIMLHLTFPKFVNKLERFYHDHYKEHRRYGEWFEISTEDVLNPSEYSDAYIIMHDALIYFEETENLTMKKPSLKFNYKEYAATRLGPLYCNVLFNVKPPDIALKTILTPNSVLVLLDKIREHDICVRAFGEKRISHVGNPDKTPISFADLKRDKFFNDYAYWEAIILGREKYRSLEAAE